jgi:predicted phosphoribosyltransferase
MRLPFRDRFQAGRYLAEELGRYQGRGDVVVLALPRGGVPVAFEVARALDASLDIFVVRKLGVPGHEELAFGAISSGDVRVLNHDVVRSLSLARDLIELVSARERKELERRENAYRDGGPPLDVDGRTVILVDDGLATGATMLAAVRALRQQNPREVVVAVPVASRQACDEFRAEVDDIVCAATPEPFYAVGEWYENFTQTTDEEVRNLLAQTAQQRHG